MMLLMREALTVGKIALSDHFFSIELTKQEAKSRIEDELSSYCVVVEQAKTTFGKVRSLRRRLGCEEGRYLPRSSHAPVRFVRPTRASYTANRTTFP